MFDTLFYLPWDATEAARKKRHFFARFNQQKTKRANQHTFSEFFGLVEESKDIVPSLIIVLRQNRMAKRSLFDT